MDNLRLGSDIGDELDGLPNWFVTSIHRLNDAILITEAEPFDPPGPKILWANAAFFRNTGYSPEEVIGQTPRLLQGPLTDRATLDRIRAALVAWQPIRAETLNYRKDGSTYWNEFEIVPVANKEGWYTHWVSVQRDVTERKLMEEKLKELASTDFLTGLLNRRSFMAVFDEELSRLNRGVQASLAVLMVDLDLFKSVNDHFGHAAGDKVLRQVATHINESKRKIDTAARLGGEEFAILLPGADEAQATVVGERLCKLVQSEPTDFDQEPIPITLSIGIAVTHAVGTTADATLARADQALYQAKANGRNRVVVAS